MADRTGWRWTTFFDVPFGIVHVEGIPRAKKEETPIGLHHPGTGYRAWVAINYATTCHYRHTETIMSTKKDQAIQSG